MLLLGIMENCGQFYLSVALLFNTQFSSVLMATHKNYILEKEIGNFLQYDSWDTMRFLRHF